MIVFKSPSTYLHIVVEIIITSSISRHLMQCLMFGGSRVTFLTFGRPVAAYRSAWRIGDDASYRTDVKKLVYYQSGSFSIT